MNVLDELLETLQLEEGFPVEVTSSSESSDDELVMLSYAAANGTQSKKTIRLHALIQNVQVQILVDCDSTNNFISEELVRTLKLATTGIPVAEVTFAGG